MEDEVLDIARIYVPVAKRKALDADKVEAIAASMLENGQTTPILVRNDGERLVLVEGLHRLEACKALGDTTILGLTVRSPRH